jgi:hypothetical protein
VQSKVGEIKMEEILFVERTKRCVNFNLLVIARAEGPWQSSAPARALCALWIATALRASQ